MIDKLTPRVASKIDQAVNGCWLWTAYLNRDGYGMVNQGGRMLKAHRVIYELLVGPIPIGLTLDHLCRIRSCVNPSHLEPVTLRVNILRGDGVTARNARRTSCRKCGGPLTPDPRPSQSGRRCAPCQTDNLSTYRARNRARNSAYQCARRVAQKENR